MLISRFLLPGPGGRLALLIAAIGCAGVAIGVASLVLVVSFMNGAEARLVSQIASADGLVFVRGRGQALSNPRRLERKIATVDGVDEATAALDGTGLVTVAGRSFGASLQGIELDRIAKSALFDRRRVLLIGRAPTAPGTLALGGSLAARLGVVPGDHASVSTVRYGPEGALIDIVDFVVSGTITTGVASFDRNRVVMPTDDLRKVLRIGSVATRLNVRLSDPDDEDAVMGRIRRRLGSDYVVESWRAMNRALFTALAQERLAMTIVISLVTIIAISNILSAMVMLVRYKAREIAILRTMGMTKTSVARVFMGVGAAIGLSGEIVGLAAGFGLKAAKDPIARALLAGMESPPPELGVLVSLPLAISGAATAWIATLVFCGVLLSTVYPAIRATAVDPAFTLRAS